MPFSQLYFSFKGRIGLKTYWLKGALPLLLLSFAPIFVFYFAEGVTNRSLEGIGQEYPVVINVLLIYDLIIFWSLFTITVKRWHDRDKSGWWTLINLIPYIGWIWAFIETGFLKGTVGANRFGEVSY